MTELVQSLIDVVCERDTQSLLLALQTLQRVPVFSQKLVRSLIDCPHHTQPCSRLLVAITQAFEGRFESKLYGRLQTYWKKRQFCTKTLVGLYCAQAPYDGYVRARIHKELVQQNYTFSEVSPWCSFMFNDQELLSNLFSIPPYPSCVCHKVLYLHHILTSTDIKDKDKEVGNLILALLCNPAHTECCTSHIDAVRFIVHKVWYTFGAERVVEFRSVVANHPDLTEELTTQLAQTNGGFPVAFNFVYDVIPTVEVQGMTSAVRDSCQVLFKTCPKTSNTLDFEFVDISQVLHVLLTYIPTSMYVEVVDIIHDDVVNSQTWLGTLLSDSDRYCIHNRSTLMYWCVQKLTLANKERVALSVLSGKHPRTPLVVDLLCDLQPSCPRLLHNSNEVHASCGDWCALLKCVRNVAVLNRVLHRLALKVTIIPDQVLTALTRRCIHQLWKCPAKYCVKYLTVIRRLRPERSPVAVAVKSLSRPLEMLPKVVSQHLELKAFLHFCRVWLGVVVFLPRHHHRRNIVTIIVLLIERPMINTLYQQLEHSVCQEFASSLQWQDIRFLQEHLLFGCLPVYLTALILQVLYASKVGRRRLFAVVTQATGGASRETCNVLAQYRARLMLQNPTLLSKCVFYHELIHSNHSVWVLVLDTASDAIIESIAVWLASDVKHPQRAQQLSTYIRRIIPRCRDFIRVEMIETLLTKFSDGPAQRYVLLCLLNLLEATEPSAFIKTPAFDVSIFRRMNDKVLGLQAQVLSKLILVGLDVERRAIAPISNTVPSELTSLIKSFAMFEIT